MTTVCAATAARATNASVFFQRGALAQCPAKWDDDLIDGTHTAGGRGRRDRQPGSPPSHLGAHKAWAVARLAQGHWMEAPHAGEDGGPAAWTTRLMPAEAKAAVRSMAQLPPADQRRLGAHVLVHAHTQDTKATARRLADDPHGDSYSYIAIVTTSSRP